MSSEFLEKIRNIIVTLFVLFFSFLVMLITFCSLRVHAAVRDLKITKNQISNIDEITYSFVGVADSIDIVAFCNSASDRTIKNISVFFLSDHLLTGNDVAFHRTEYVTDIKDNSVLQHYDSDWYFKELATYHLSDGRYVYGASVYNFDSYETAFDGSYVLVDKIINSDTEMTKFLNDFYVNKTITPLDKVGSDFDPHDDAYAFTGFSMSGKTATWTGTTERSYLLDMDVEEWVNYTYGFATSEDQEVSSFIDAEAHYPTSDKKLALPWDEMEANKKEGEFIRQVNIIPCYGTSGAGFYFGSPVCVYFDVNGKIESIVQNSVPTDGEVIGNNISLIGFRYDTSFHAEFVDVWSNAVNCSAFDLGGSQYLSLGVKALYYNGQSKDIDFVSLDRKNLVWDKTFDSFKTFNGSGIKQLFFTPYIKTGVNNPWNKGNSIVIDFDVNGNATSSFDTGDDGTVHLSDFKLTGVVWNKPMLSYGTITWTGTTANSDMSIVPDSDTLVVCSYPVYDSSLNESYETYDTVTIGKGSIRVYIDSLIDKYTNAGKTWNGEMWLTPCYKKGGVLYMGEPVIVNCTKGTVSDIEVDESTGTANQVDKTDENKSYADAILSSGNNFFSIVKGLIASMQQLPELIATLFSFLPGWVNALIAGSIFIIFVCRILGR